MGPSVNLHLVPPYFVELTDLTQEQAQQAAVRSTVTGHTLATVTAPRPYNVFTWVSGAADDRTFVLAAQHWQNIASGQAGMPAESRDNTAPTVFFRLTFHSNIMGVLAGNKFTPIPHGTDEFIQIAW